MCEMTIYILCAVCFYHASDEKSVVRSMVWPYHAAAALGEMIRKESHEQGEEAHIRGNSDRGVKD